MTKMADLLFRIAGSLKRGKGNCGVGVQPDGKFSLVTGAPSAVKVDGGLVVCLGLSRDRLAELRDEIDGLLAERQ